MLVKGPNILLSFVSHNYNATQYAVNSWQCGSYFTHKPPTTSLSLICSQSINLTCKITNCCYTQAKELNLVADHLITSISPLEGFKAE